MELVLSFIWRFTLHIIKESLEYHWETSSFSFKMLSKASQAAAATFPFIFGCFVQEDF
jgi:hypothetical protein